jgi:uncharacterized protein (TIGR01244 family)
MILFKFANLKALPANLLAVALFFSLAWRVNAAAESAPPNQTAIEKIELGEIRNLSHFGDGIYLSGQPKAGDFILLADRGVKVVVNLRGAAEMAALGFDEEAAVEQAGMQYLHIPIDSGQPDTKKVDRLLNLLSNSGENPLIVHCGSANRVGYIWSMFRAIEEDIAVDDAVVEGKEVGLRNPGLEKFAREYVEWRETTKSPN